MTSVAVWGGADLLGSDAGIQDTAALAEKHSSRRAPGPAEGGALALSLRAPFAHRLAGATIPVDGGWTAQSEPDLRIYMQAIA